jgi:GTP-binding protein
MMNIKVCRIQASASRPEDFPREGFPEVAFMGRSNVGKSSLINRLLGSRGLARTSKAPGRTRAINFYRVNECLDFVDLPGYGYARVPAPLRRQWKGLVESYLEAPGRPTLAVLLVDARHEPTELDGQLLEWLLSRSIRHQVVLTKIDKVSGNDRTRAQNRGARWLGLPPGELPIALSAVTGDGIPGLWRAIDAACSAHRSLAQSPPPIRDGAFDSDRAAGDATPRRVAEHDDPGQVRNRFQGGRISQ